MEIFASAKYRRVMQLKQTPELSHFLSTYFAEADPEADEQTTAAFVAASPAGTREKVVTQLKAFAGSAEISIEDLGTEANRWFGDAEEARAWLNQILNYLQKSGSASSGEAIVVKDSNGTPLTEGDSVLVIKDLKVKGGSSDLKRGTMIRKIHLIDDPDNIECRVDGSTLVLKTCFLKKA